MPGKNGRQVFDEIALIDPRIRAIFMSGYTGDIIIDKGIEKEKVEFLQKPLSVAKLLAKVRDVLDRQPGKMVRFERFLCREVVNESPHEQDPHR